MSDSLEYRTRKTHKLYCRIAVYDLPNGKKQYKYKKVGYIRNDAKGGKHIFLYKSFDPSLYLRTKDGIDGEIFLKPVMIPDHWIK